ncbi:flagellin N-terminal helical domain-containing protein [Azospirillum argentinense]|nr:hypothetical protein [Azospirillum argentinense]
MVSPDLQLPTAMRANLLTIQAGQQQMSAAQQRLATGLKINAALDNPPVYFAAKALTQRASDLSAMKDSIGQAISTIKAGDKGVSGIGSLLKQARGLTTAALTSLGMDAGSIQTRRNLADQFDGILEQINGTAGDSGYGCKNLLMGDGSKMEATTESKLAVQNLIGIRRARVTDISEPDDYQITITGSGRITGAAGDIANAEQALGLAAVKITGVKSPTSGDFNPISITVSGGPGTDKVITATNPPDSFTQRFTAAQWHAADAAATPLKFDHSFPGGARIRFDVDFDLIDATPQNVGTRIAQIEKQIDLAVSVTDSTGYSATRNGKNAQGMVKLNDGENSFVFPSGTVRLDVDLKSISPQGEWYAEFNDLGYDNTGIPPLSVAGVPKSLARQYLPFDRSNIITYGTGVEDSYAPGFRTLEAYDFRYGYTASTFVPNSAVTNYPIFLSDGTPDNGINIRVNLSANVTPSTQTVGWSGLAIDSPILSETSRSDRYFHASAGFQLDTITGFNPGINTKLRMLWGGLDSGGPGFTTFDVIDDSGRRFSTNLPNESSSLSGGLEVHFPENDTYPASSVILGFSYNFTAFPEPGWQESQIYWPGGSSSEANLETALVNPASRSNDMFVAFDAAYQNGITVESQNLQVDGKGLHVDFSQNGWMDRADIENAITGLDTAEQRVRSASQAFMTGLGIITTREDFLKGFSDVLDEGAAKLTLADQNKEGATLLTLQTRQQLSQTALGLANQNQQAILSLFR